MPDPTPEQRRLRRRFEMKVRRFTLDNGLLTADSKVLVAVSGGADSTALLLSLAQIAHRGGFELAVAHFDHQMRGEETSVREAGFVNGLTASLGLTFYQGSGDVREVANRTGMSLETAAREVRYAFLKAAAIEYGFDCVVTGHTASDQAETVLMHLVRGSGLHGIAGMAKESSWQLAPRLSLVRPLLRMTREETEAYCAAAGVDPIDDESNRSPDHERNRVRHELMPLLRSFNPRIEEAVVRLADAARVDVDYLDGEAIEGIANDSTDRSVRYTWNRPSARPEALRRHGLRTAVKLLLGDSEGFAESHFLAMEHVMFRGQTGDRLSLPHDVTADRGRDFIKLTVGVPPNPVLPDGEVTLTVPGLVRFGDLKAQSGTEKPARNRGLGVDVDAEAAGSKLILRHRRNGDRFQPLGMSGTKKLQDFFINARIPSHERDNVPIFESESGIIWVGGMRIAEWARPQPGRPTVYLSYEHA